MKLTGVAAKQRKRFKATTDSNCWDNGVAESFFGSLNIEQVFGMRYLSLSAARQDIVDYIEMLHNSRRRHSSLGYMNPMEFEKQML